MASAPQFKVYSAEGEYLAAFKDVVHAAVLVDWLGKGASIRLGHSKKLTLWVEGNEDQPASESWDFVEEVVDRRMDALYAPLKAQLEAEKAGK